MSLSPTLENPATETETRRPKVGFVSLGCPKNLVDSEVMMGLLHRGGAELTPRAEDAEILVVNTCSFIDSAKQESVDTILEMVQHKIANGGRAQKLIVAGCLVERYRDEIRKNIPEVDAVVGTGELEAIMEAAGLSRPTPAENNSPFAILTTAQIERHASSVNQHSRPESDGPQIAHEATRNISSDAQSSRPEGDAREQAGRFSREAWDGATAALPNYLYSDETPRILTTPRASAYIKIAEGCDHPCSFCIIPQLRGKFRSRPLASIVAETKSLIAQGVREITLIGQDTTCYGEDLPKDAVTGKRPELADLLDALAPLPGLKWLRFLYAYPNKVTTRLLESIAKHDTVAKYLDVPLQHASANVLRRMKRGGTSHRFLQIIDKARSIVPGLVLRTSFIVGFPGETEADFEELLAFVQEAKIDWLGVFSYSDEEGAGAFSLDEKVPKRTIEARRRKLMKLQNKISTKARRAWVGREIDLLVEGESEETELLWQGRSLDQAPEIDGKVLINDFGPHEVLVPGTFYRAEITESHDYDVVARIIE
ncbi:30S ribosomal protein S12 methylthiotransferase RimO [Granulicella mallensis]|uniref:Ribosomal protein uS12 methylthiotransferase RimO n=1 Tax=Granulicella mallensis (strain ATCC BAA-1857 / DSM 23137 / MP5ACTX8) TaxID=682795 RepID=G8NXW8_GRAMM|nr:30S ribosomal protein S12 methylthiotransferase RimO [Granulicella mallensis]AEU35556.1 Ribosomal protein S12 methylthiotransferase rimO [Granulicella mallensis MP5ACTX8]